MASITWPSTLPSPLQDSYQETPPNTTIRTTMDSGPAKVRRRYTAGVRPMALSYHLTKAQMATLDTFYVSTTASGSLRFNFPHPRTGATVEARFTAEPSYSTIDYEGAATVSLEVLP